VLPVDDSHHDHVAALGGRELEGLLTAVEEPV